MTSYVLQISRPSFLSRNERVRADSLSLLHLAFLSSRQTYSITLQTHVSNGKSSSWSAISLPDLQLDFTMLDPHVRANLVAVESGNKHASEQEYTVDFKIPDRHGVFKFLVDYKRAG